MPVCSVTQIFIVGIRDLVLKCSSIGDIENARAASWAEKD